HGWVVEAPVAPGNSRVGENDDGSGSSAGAVRRLDLFREAGGFGDIDDDTFGEPEDCFAGRQTDGSGTSHSSGRCIFVDDDERQWLLGGRSFLLSILELAQVKRTSGDFEGNRNGAGGQKQGSNTNHAQQDSASTGCDKLGLRLA
ncbi:MAG: hypothetical protein ACPGAP_05595, partial [Akkermansiaceae bacterium]